MNIHLGYRPGCVIHGPIAIGGSHHDASGSQWGKEVTEQLFTCQIGL